jgi:hypothetical protein
MYLLLRDESLGALTSESVTSSEWWDAALTVLGTAAARKPVAHAFWCADRQQPNTLGIGTGIR